MEILIHKDTGCCGHGTISFDIHRNGWCDRNKSTETKDEYKTTIQRNGYMRKIIPLHCMIHGQSEYKVLQDLKTTKEQLFNLFGISDTKNSEYLVKNVEPWICFSEALELVLYFGEDKPVRKEKTVKSNTKHRLTWAHYSKHQFDGTPATYKYWDVKDKTKLIICSIHLDYLEYTFPELEYKFDRYWCCCDNPKIPELILNEPFKASREYDYSDEEKKVIIEKEQRKREEEERKRKELEERKNTPGYCHLCGAEHAEYNPFEGMYMCDECYWDSKY